jgi:hypothetical protein
MQGFSAEGVQGTRLGVEAADVMKITLLRLRPL